MTRAAPTVMLLARHGETDWNRDRRWQGSADLPLNARGRRQAEALARRLATTRLDAVYSSDLRRASETAAIVAERHGLSVNQLSALREVDCGSWTGLSRKEARERFPAGWEGGESYEELATRVVAAVRAIGEAHPGGQLLIVSHSGAIKAIGAQALGVDFEDYRRDAPKVGKGSLCVLAYERGAFRPLDGTRLGDAEGSGWRAGRKRIIPGINALVFGISPGMDTLVSVLG